MSIKDVRIDDDHHHHDNTVRSFLSNHNYFFFLRSNQHSMQFSFVKNELERKNIKIRFRLSGFAKNEKIHHFFGCCWLPVYHGLDESFSHIIIIRIIIINERTKQQQTSDVEKRCKNERKKLIN